RSRETALAQIATHPVLEALGHDHQGTSSDRDAGRDQQTICKSEFGDPHNSDAQSDGPDNRCELIGRTAPVPTTIDRQRSADEEYDRGDHRTHEHARNVDEWSVK